MKMKAPAESGQASWSQISRTWLKHVATSTADELCLAWGSGSSYAAQHTGKKKLLIGKQPQLQCCNVAVKQLSFNYILATKQFINY